MTLKTIAFKNLKKKHFLILKMCSFCLFVTYSRLLRVQYDIIFVEGSCTCTKLNVFTEFVMNLQASTQVFRKKNNF